MRVAVAKYPIQAPVDFAAFAARQADVLAQAKRAGATLAVLPEYLALELASTLPAAIAADLGRTLSALQPLQQAWCDLYAGLAVATGMTIQAGTFLAQVAPGRYRNRAWWFAPDGRSDFQDKLQLTAFEQALGVIDGGDALRVFDMAGARAGIAICYDSEFPLPVRAQREAGARLLLVPSCTDTPAGATRVGVGCAARALENRMFVARAVTAGVAEWNPALDINTGEAAIYAPMDHGFPADGLLARTRGDALWAVADLDIAALSATHARAQVSVDADWSRQRQVVAPMPD